MSRHPQMAVVGSLWMLVFGSWSTATAENVAQVDRRGVIPVDRTARPTAQTLADAVQPLSSVDLIRLPPLDLDAVAAEDELDSLQGLAPRYAVPNRVSVNTATAGTWEQVDDETMMWRLRIVASDALSVNLGFTRFIMPPGGRLFFYAADFGHVIRPFTDADNEDHEQLWTPPVLAGDVVVEVTVPTVVRDQLRLELSAINHGYRGFGHAGRQRSGACNVDVVCPQGDGWREQISTVAVISTGGSRFCTGFMVNNTAADLTPFFMTANHCGISSGVAPSLVVFWNYDNSTCRPPGSPESGGPGDGPLDQFQTGSLHRASYSPSDFTLVQLDDMPDPAWNVGYGGWDRSSADATSAVAIHQPSTDEKRISFEYDPTSTTSYLGTSSPGNGTHVRVTDWDLGTTEPGSSGSPLFDHNQRVVGQLHGGYAACGNNDADWYGRFSVSWDGGGSPSSSLKDWLDPGSTGAMTVDFLSEATQCSDAGEITLDRAEYACEGVALIEVVDCGLNLDDNVLDTTVVTIESDSEPAGEAVTLTETSDKSGKFEGTITLTGLDSPGRLLVAPGDTVTATYIDADDGAGGNDITVTANATIDCTPPVISDVLAINIEAGSATIRFRADELAVGTVHYGTSCGSPTHTAIGTEYGTVVNVDVSEGINFSTTYYYTVEAADEAGNSSADDNGGSCYSFATPEVPNFFTEQFSGDNDLDNHKILFTPNGSNDFYVACAQSITALPTDPAGGGVMGLPDDGFQLATVGGGERVSLYGTDYTSFYVGSNGYITFTAGDDDYDETLEKHFGAPPRISALYDDLNPSTGGQVSWKQLADRVAVTWLNVPEYGTGNSNTFQVEMFFDGSIQLSYLAIAATDGITGLSRGTGMSPDYFEVDLLDVAACEVLPPAAPGPPADPQHDVRKHRYITIDATTNALRPVALKVEIAEMNRCQNDLRRSCLDDEDCPTVCAAAPDIHTCGSGSACPDGICIESGPCVPHPDVGLTWFVQAPQTRGANCPNGMCDEEDWYARVDASVYGSDWNDECNDPDWTGGCATLHIGDCEIIPCVSYNVYACDPGDTDFCSEPLAVATQVKPELMSHYGDVAGEVTLQLEFYPPDGFTNVLDISAYLHTNQNWGTTNLPQAHPTWIDLHGLGAGIPPQYVLGVTDLTMIMRAWVNSWPWENSIGGLAPGECP